MLRHLLNRKSDLSVRDGVLPYKRLIRPMMDYVCPTSRPAARTYVRRLEVLQSKYLRLASGASWYASNRQIHEDVSVSLFGDHFRALIASFDSKIAYVGNPLLRQIVRYLRRPRVEPVAWRVSQGRQEPAGQSWRWPSRPNESRSALISRALFCYPD
jgi:hypothetical protein